MKPFNFSLMKSLHHDLVSIFEPMQPTILLGMHRSGTSLTARLLMDLGIFMGNRLSLDAEAVQFQKLNIQIFKAAGARWSHVRPLIRSVESDEFLRSQSDAVRRGLFREKYMPGFINTHIKHFFGRRWSDLNRDNRMAWGWKDPRTTITFPIWLRIFPQARFLHVFRNGIDVAASLVRRTHKQQRKWRHRLFPVTYSPSTLDFKYCFHLWEDYVSFVLKKKSLIPESQYMEIYYEDLLSNPFYQVSRVLDFLEFPVEAATIREVCSQINSSRLDNSAFTSPYRDMIPELASSPVMKQLGFRYDLAH